MYSFQKAIVTRKIISTFIVIAGDIYYILRYILTTKKTDNNNICIYNILYSD